MCFFDFNFGIDNRIPRSETLIRGNRQFEIKINQKFLKEICEDDREGGEGNMFVPHNGGNWKKRVRLNCSMKV